MNPFKYAVSFRIRHPSVDPHEISAVLSLIPDYSWRAGNSKSSPSGQLLEGDYTFSYWSYSLDYQPETGLAECLEAFTTRLESHSDFLADIISTGGNCEYFVGWFSGANSGEVFYHQLLSRLARLQIDLALDIFGHIDTLETKPK